MNGTFNRFDICEAWNVLAHNWGLYDVKTRLDRMRFKSSHSAEFYEGLSENGQAIYGAGDAALRSGASAIKSRFK